MGILSDNKPFLLFLGKFALSYLVLTGIYMLYLSQYDAAAYQTDDITHIVGRQSSALVRFLGQDSHIAPHPKEASDKFYVNNKYVARIVEGCNAVSVMILFAAFIVAFSTTFKRTALYILAGFIVIYLLNILRIALITIAACFYPQYDSFIHDIVFPVFIYGVVFILWVVWVLKFYKNARKA